MAGCDWRGCCGCWRCCLSCWRCGSGSVASNGKHSWRDLQRLNQVADPLKLPPGGLVLTWPYRTAPGATRINGKPAQWKDGELRITALPARVVVTSP